MQARSINGGVEYVSQLKQEEGSFKQGGPTSTGHVWLEDGITVAPLTKNLE